MILNDGPCLENIQEILEKEKQMLISSDPIELPLSQVENKKLADILKSEAEKQAAIDRINGFRERIINGEDFSTLAILYSDDEGSAKNGGELGFKVIDKDITLSVFTTIRFTNPVSLHFFKRFTPFYFIQI